MEINYNTIIQYLCNDNIEHKFLSSKRITNSITSFPKEFVEIFNSINAKDIFRYGITSHNKDINISFLTSLLTLLSKDFKVIDVDDEIIFVNKFVQDIHQVFKDKQFKFELRNKFSRHILIDRLAKFDFTDGILIQAISQILDINFIFFNFETKEIESVFPFEYLNPWKPVLLFAKYDNYYEPIFDNETYRFNYNHNFIKRLLNMDIVYLNSDLLEKEYELLDNINDIIEDDDVELVEEDDDTFISPKNIISKFNKTQLKKMKKDEIIDLIKNNNLNIDIKQNKTDIIDDFLNYSNLST